MTEPDAGARALSFGVAAAAYERGRPTYPADAVDWLIPAGARRVVDLGAGTGKFTRQLCGRNLEVIAVEPSDGMREQLRVAVPGAQVLGGTAEDMHLPDGSVDAVFVAQAWHWVDPARAVKEVARVLVPGGRLGLLWNVRDERNAWVAALTEIMHRHGESDDGDVDPVVGPPFGPMERLHVEWTHHLTGDAVVDLVTSRSYVIIMPRAQRRKVLDEVRALVDAQAAPDGSRDVAIPYVTHCSRTHLP